MPITVRQRSINLKNGAKRSASFTKGKKGRKGSEGEFLVTNAPSDLRSIAYPGGAVAIVLLCIARFSSAIWGHISDCDETYNYWEPLHYLVYGSGLQTWEYSPAFAIRSYMPLWLLAVPSKLMSYFMSPLSIFYMVRLLLAFFTAVAELMFYKSICHEFGVHVGRVWLALALPAAGCFAASAALLPSAWSHAGLALATACWLKKRYPAAIVFTAANALLSWPFTALLGLPIAIDMIIMKRRLTEFIRWSVISLVVLLVPTVAVDSWHYGRLVVAPWNIVSYNIFTEHGPDLYGVEPWTYYFVNGFLNFNLVWVLALSCPLLLSACAVLTLSAAPRASFCLPYWLSLSPLYIWLAVFVLQPHKEERFIYPVYVWVVLCAAVSLDCAQKMTFAVGSELRLWRPRRRHYLEYTAPLVCLCVLVAGGLGISRTVALYNNYHGPMTLLPHLPPSSDPSVPSYVCFGKDWYRSPSSFHLPDEGYALRFVKSDFNGQMPAPYSAGSDSTRKIHPYFNGQNKEDNSTYLQPSQCHYLVDSDIGTPTDNQPAYHTDTDQWEIIAKQQIIDADKSHRIFRAFYVPYLSHSRCVYANIYLLKNKLLLGD